MMWKTHGFLGTWSINCGCSTSMSGVSWQESQYERDKLDFGSSWVFPQWKIWFRRTGAEQPLKKFWKNTARIRQVSSHENSKGYGGYETATHPQKSHSFYRIPPISNAGIQRGSSPARPTSLWEASRASTPPDARDGWFGGWNHGETVKHTKKEQGYI